MSPEEYRKIKQIFESAVDLTPAELSDFLESECGEDESLRSEVERMLLARDSEFLKDPAMAEIADALLDEENRDKATRILPGTGTSFGHYKLISKIGKGGMGEVFLARDTTLDRNVAIKILPKELTHDPERLRRFEQEARTVSALNHPFILTIHEFGKSDDGTHYIVSEFVEGKTLDEFCAGENIDLVEKLDVAIQIASALSAAHAAGIIHRDIKPQNIIVRPDRYVKVLDFGLAKLIPGFKPTDSDPEAATRPLIETQSGMVMGTASYMSPEQAMGLEVDARSDIFSFGVLLYEMISGRLPFEGTTPFDVIAAILHKEPSPIVDSHVPLEFGEIIGQALEKDRVQRFQNMEELVRGLKTLRTIVVSLDEAGRPSNVGRVPKTDVVHVSTNEKRLRTTALDAVETKNMASRYSVVLKYIVPVVFIGSIGSLYWGYFLAGSKGVSNLPRGSYETTEITNWSSQTGELSTSAKFSPDGKMIAFGSTKGGTPGIWVTQTNSSEPIRITKDKFYNRFPIWSPTGEELAYSSARGNEFGIWRIPFMGGRQTMIAKIRNSEPKLKRWASSGKLYFQKRNNLFFIDLKTKQIRKVTDIQEEDRAIRILTVSPDESQIAYVSKEGKEWKIYVGPTQSKSRSQIVSSLARISEVVWHPDGSALLFSRREGNSYQIFQIRLGLGDLVQVTTSEKDSHVKDVTADSSRILITSAIENADLWRINVANGKESVVAASKNAELWPDISPDGKTIAYQSIERLNKANNLFSGSIVTRSALNGDTPTTLVDDGYLPQWSKNGKYLSFMRLRDGNRGLWVIPATGGEARLLAESGAQGFDYSMTPYNKVDVTHLSWTASGESIVYPAIENDISNLWLVTLDERKTRLTNNANSSVRIKSPILSLNGRFVVYVARARKRGPKRKRTYQIWLKRFVDSKARKLYQFEDQLRLLGLSESENAAVVIRRNESLEDSVQTPLEAEIMLVSISNGTVKVIKTIRKANFYSSHLSPDGKAICYTIRKDGNEEIWLTSLDTVVDRKLLEINDPRVMIADLSWSSDGKTIFFGKQSRFTLLSLLGKSQRNGDKS